MTDPLPRTPAPTTHELKVWEQFFDALASGLKSFEYRTDDREPRYAVGDVLRLREWERVGIADGRYSGREVLRRVTYIARENEVIPEGYCIMSLEPVPAPAPTPETAPATCSEPCGDCSTECAASSPTTFRECKTCETPGECGGSGEARTAPSPDTAKFVEAWLREAARFWHTSPIAERLDECIAFVRSADASRGTAPSPTTAIWKCLRDPARPSWPGVLVVTDNFADGFISVDAGQPKNFADSLALAERIAAALNAARCAMSLINPHAPPELWSGGLVWSNLAIDWAKPKDAGEIDLSKVASKLPNPDPYAFINAAQKLLFEALGKPCPKCGECYSVTHPYGICKKSEDPT